MAPQFYYALGLVLFLTIVQRGSSLQCWSCSSDLDPSCHDHFNASRYLGLRNYYNRPPVDPQYQRNDQPTLIECTNSLGGIYGQKQVCVKRVINVPYGRPVVSRECKAVSTNQGSGTCPERNTNVEFCEYCEYDGCNAATGLKTNVILAIAIPSAVLLFLKR